MQDLTRGSLTRHVLASASYTLGGMVVQTLYILIDLYWVGHLGTAAMAAVGISSNVMFLVLAGSQMLGVGTATLVAHAVGRQDRAEAERVFNQAQGLGVLVGTVFTGVALGLRVPYARMLAADAATAQLAAGFMTWFIPAMALQFALVAMVSGLRGAGNFRTGAVVQATTVLLNLVLAPALMFGWVGLPALGVPGAGLSSLAASSIGVIWLTVVYLSHGAYLRLQPRRWRPEWAVCRRLLAIGLPAGAEFALLAAYLVLVYTVVRPFGPAAQAGFGIGMRILQACFMPAVAIGFAAGPVAAQNVGAGQPDRVKQTFVTASLLAGGTMACAAIALWAAAAPIVGVFTRDAAVIRAGEDYLHIAALSFVASGIVFVASSLFQALGNAWPSLAASTLRLVVVAVPVLALSRLHGFSLAWIWRLSVASVYIHLAVSLWLLRREFRRRLPATDARQVQSGAPDRDAAVVG